MTEGNSCEYKGTFIFNEVKNSVGGALTHYHMLKEAHLPSSHRRKPTLHTPTRGRISPSPAMAQPMRTQPKSPSPLPPFPKSKPPPLFSGLAHGLPWLPCLKLQFFCYYPIQ